MMKGMIQSKEVQIKTFRLICQLYHRHKIYIIWEILMIITDVIILVLTILLLHNQNTIEASQTDQLYSINAINNTACKNLIQQVLPSTFHNNKTILKAPYVTKRKDNQTKT